MSNKLSCEEIDALRAKVAYQAAIIQRLQQECDERKYLMHLGAEHARRLR